MDIIVGSNEVCRLAALRIQLEEDHTNFNMLLEKYNEADQTLHLLKAELSALQVSIPVNRISMFL